MNVIRFSTFIALFIALVGCSSGKEKLETYLDNPATLIEDPHYASYEEKASALEHQYLAKEITFADYQERKKELEKKYTAEVQRREAILSDK